MRTKPCRDTAILLSASILPGLIVLSIGVLANRAWGQFSGNKGCYYRIHNVQNINGACDAGGYEPGDTICVACETVGNPCTDYGDQGHIYEPVPGCKLGVVRLDEVCLSNCIAKKGNQGGGPGDPPDDPHFTH